MSFYINKGCPKSNIFICVLLFPILFYFNVNNVFCYFPQSVLLQEDCCVKGGNIDIIKVEVRARLQQFLSTTFDRFYIFIWSCMLLEDVMARGGTSSIQVRF